MTAPGSRNLLKGLDYSVVQQCMHCGMCLPTCPTYEITKLERNSPRGRIALMRAIADDRLPVSKSFADEMYYCLGCLACKTSCPAGVDYPRLFETARAEIERSGAADRPGRKFLRWISLRILFGNPSLLHLCGRLLYFYQTSGLRWLVRKSGILHLLPEKFGQMEAMAPDIQQSFSDEQIRPEEKPPAFKHSVGLLTGCVQDMAYPDVNRATADVLLAAGCRVVTPRSQSCCGSLHAHNGDLEAARDFARKLMDQFDLDSIDAIITNAGGCGSHLKDYHHLLENDPVYADKARLWSAKLKDIHEWLVEIGFTEQIKNRESKIGSLKITYHDSCHLAHGQGIVQQPRRLLQAIPGMELVELPEASWCCGSAGVYNITQPDTAALLARRKLGHIRETGCSTVATANPGCLLQLKKFAEQENFPLTVLHPVQLLAAHLADNSLSDSPKPEAVHP